MFFLVGEPEFDWRSAALDFVGKGLVLDMLLGSAIAKELFDKGYLGGAYLTLLPLVNSFHMTLD